MNEVPAAPSLVIRPTLASDYAAIATLHARAFGPGRFARTAYRLREAGDTNHANLKACSQTGWVGETIAAAATMTPVTIGGDQHAMLLGPVVVAPEFSGHRFGEPLVRAALAAAKDAGSEMVILVGDLAYYERFGFAPVPAGQIQFPGPVDPKRILARTWTNTKISDAHGILGPQ